MKESSNMQVNSERGQSLVEFAISLTFILILLAGVVDFGRAFFTFVELRDAAQEGALYGSTSPIIDANDNGQYDAGESTNEAAIRSRVRSTSSTPLDLNDPGVLPDDNISINFSGDPCEGNTVQVTITYDYPISMPLIGGIIGSQTIPLTAQATDTILIPACSS
jgi:Flp pilus assembly protein TadG